MPDDMAADDFEGIARHHPAYRHTISIESLSKMRSELDEAQFLRAAGNRWTEVIGAAIDAGLWRAASDNVPAIPAGCKVGYGAARSADGEQVVIAIAADTSAGVIVEILDVLDHAFGAAETVARWATDGVTVVDPSGPSAGLAADLAKLLEPDKLYQLRGSDVPAATAAILDGLKVTAHKYRPHPALTAAVAAAGKRRIGDGGYAWARTSSAVPVAALEAATNAVDALGRQGIDYGGIGTRHAA
jgi:hypothetical protein